MPDISIKIITRDNIASDHEGNIDPELATSSESTVGTGYDALLDDDDAQWSDDDFVGIESQQDDESGPRIFYGKENDGEYSSHIPINPNTLANATIMERIINRAYRNTPPNSVTSVQAHRQQQQLSNDSSTTRPEIVRNQHQTNSYMPASDSSEREVPEFLRQEAMAQQLYDKTSQAVTDLMSTLRRQRKEDRDEYLATIKECFNERKRQRAEERQEMFNMTREFLKEAAELLSTEPNPPNNDEHPI